MDAGANPAEDCTIEGEHGEQSVNARGQQETNALVARSRV
jgi:hypothetical protein